MKKTSFTSFPIVVAGVCLAVFVMTSDAFKLEHPKFRADSNDILPGRYIVSFSDKKAQASTLSIQSESPEEADVKIVKKFSHDFFNGASIKIDTEDVDAEILSLNNILDRTDVKSVTPIRLIKRPEVTINAIDPDVYVPSVVPHHMTQVDRVHNELNNKGKGILVGVIDTGIDYLHPALGGGFGPGFKVTKGYDLVGNNYNGYTTPVPDSDPMDSCTAASGASGHGTHVSGIIAGYDAATNFTGVAPEANLAMYRVFGCTGSVATDIIIQGLLMAYDAGSDVISISIGSTNPWGSGDPQMEVVNKIIAAGVNVVVSAGNSGSDGVYTVGQPSTASAGFAVASIDNAYQQSASLTATGISHKIEYLASNTDTIEAGSVALSDPTAASTTDACTPESVSPNVSGKIALIQRGTCNFAVKVINAANAGASAIAFYNNVDGIILVSAPGAPIPVISISKADGEEIVASLAKGDVSFEFNKSDVSPSDTGNTVSYFSSTGPEPELNFKPNIAGIGGNVYSTLPSFLGSWGLMSGTSMAAPYVAGSIALYIKSEAGKKKPAPFVFEQFQNYALPVKVYGSNETDSPIRQGAGLVQVYDAITQKTHITPSQISFNDTATTKYKTQTITITNYGTQTVSYELKNIVSTGVAPYEIGSGDYTPLEPAIDTTAAASLRFSSKTFKLAAGKSKSIKVTVTPPKTDPNDHIIYGGSIHIISKQQSINTDTKIPYFGVVGAQKTLPIFDFASEFPTVLSLQSQIYGPNDTFTYDRTKSSTRPVAVLRLLTPTKTIKAELIDPVTQKALGVFLTGLEYFGRDTLTVGNQYTTWIWDGTYIPASLPDLTTAIPAPAATYLWRLSALKLLGDPKNKNDWEVWTSGPIVVKN